MPRLPLPESFYNMPRWVRNIVTPKRKENLQIDYTKFEINENGTLVDIKTKEPVPDAKPESSDFYNANLFSSKVSENLHYPVLDIDVPLYAVESSTSGHHHVYIGCGMNDAQMEKLIETLVEVGIMQPGIRDMQWKRFGELTVRPPWVKKYDDRSFLEQERNALTNQERETLEFMKNELEIFHKMFEKETHKDLKNYYQRVIADHTKHISELEARENFEPLEEKDA